ncbi:hypothetical protein EXS73_02225, partial [Candidatus Pacearchaeota archaeon]|nr:hypothetical protein [Candidatus Pacearchaeota archaeon]
MTPGGVFLPTIPSSRWVPLLYIGSNGLLHGSFGYHGVTTALTSTSTVNNAQWHQAILTFNNGVETLYVDGVQTGQRTGLSQSEFPTPATGYTYLLGAAYLAAPWQGVNSSTWRVFEGLVDQVQLYSVALSSSEANSLYAQQMPLFIAPVVS